MELQEGDEVVSSSGVLEGSSFPRVYGKCTCAIDYSGGEPLCPGCRTAVSAFSEQNPADAEVIETYLDDVRSLAREIEVSIDAVRSSSHKILMESVSRQEMLCGDLRARASRAQHAIWTYRGISEARYERELRVLRFQVCTYDALLRSCSKNNTLLISVYKSFFGSFGSGKMPVAGSKTLVCKA